MRFRVENLGPLREAEVDLGKDLIVLTGPNNSGKTYLAWAVYGLHSDHLDKPKKIWEDPALAAFTDITKSEVDVTSTPPHWNNILQIIGEACTSQLPRMFASAPEAFAATTVSLQHTEESVAIVGARMMEARRLVMTDKELSTQQQGELLELVVWLSLFPSTTLFPAERIALNIFAKELELKQSEKLSEIVDEILRKVPKEAIQRRAGRYSWPIRDSLQIANDLANLSKNKTAFTDLAEDLERTVLGGAISISDLGELSFRPEQAKDHPLPVHLTASVVKSLASLVFYFRHQANEGDFLIIDEPELNLHPDAQRRVIRVLAKAVKRGFKIMMSTHSDYVLRELNHLVMLSDPQDAVDRVIDELGYDRASILQPEKLGVYLFKDQTCKEVPVTVDGFEVETIERAIAKLNADAQAIYAARFG